MASLPPGWEERVHHDGRHYYVNHTTKTTSWTRPGRRSEGEGHPAPQHLPVATVTAIIPPISAAPTTTQQRAPVAMATATPLSSYTLPPGWEQRVHTDGRVYFLNHTTKPTSWTPPVPVVAGVPLRQAAAAQAPAADAVIKPSGVRRALLIGINYPGTRCALKGCVNDATRMRDYLRSCGFDDKRIRVLRDDGKGRRASNSRLYESAALPTRSNIIEGLRWLVSSAKRGDCLFFHYSGHGGQVRDQSGDEADGYDETIIPCDHKCAGQITDDELFKILVKDLPEGCKLTAVIDCCHSGTGLDLPYDYQSGRGWRCEDVPFHTRGDVQMLSGCEDAQTSADTSHNFSAGGAMTNALLKALKDNPMPLYPDLFRALHANLRKKGFRQRPQLTSSQPFDVRDRVFSLTDGFVPNHNAVYGVPPGAKHRHRRCRQRRGTGGMGLEGVVAARMGAGILAPVFGSSVFS